MTHDMNIERLENATRARLAALTHQPVDTAALEARLEAEIDRQRTHRRNLRFPMISRWAAAAAAIVVAVSLLFVFDASQTPVMAAPAMVQLHQDIQAGRVPLIAVDSPAEARQVIESSWEGGPTVPLVELPVESCCLTELQDRRVACMLIRTEDQPITVAIAKAGDFRPAHNGSIDRNGRTYHVTEHDGVSMVMTRDADRWLCFMGEISSDRMVEFVEKLVH